MSFKCKIGLHSWNGCKCSKCDKTRDEEHDLSANCTQCSICGKFSAKEHNYIEDCEICSICGFPGTYGHNWYGCKCIKCGKIRDEGHRWSDDDCSICSSCGKKRKEHHDWSKDCEKCANCNKKSGKLHIWNGCTCTKCGKIQNLGHLWNGCVCSICGFSQSGTKAHQWNHETLECDICRKKIPLVFSNPRRWYYDLLGLSFMLATDQKEIEPFLDIWGKPLNNVINLMTFIEKNPIFKVAGTPDDTKAMNDAETLYTDIIEFNNKHTSSEVIEMCEFMRFIGLAWIYSPLITESDRCPGKEYALFTILFWLGDKAADINLFYHMAGIIRPTAYKDNFLKVAFHKKCLHRTSTCIDEPDIEGLIEYYINKASKAFLQFGPSTGSILRLSPIETQLNFLLEDKYSKSFKIKILELYINMLFFSKAAYIVSGSWTFATKEMDKLMNIPIGSTHEKYTRKA